MNEEIQVFLKKFFHLLKAQKINQGLVKNLTEKSHTLQRYENSKQIFSEFNQKKAAKELRIQDIKYSITQQEVILLVDIMLK